MLIMFNVSKVKGKNDISFTAAEALVVIEVVGRGSSSSK
jgi:hypothetical protein